MDAQVDPIEVGGIVLLFASFFLVPQITHMLRSSIDTLPMRFAAVILVLGSLSYNKFMALGLFLVIMAIYIHHHHDAVLEVLGTANNLSSLSSGQGANIALSKLDKGGHAEESYDSSDFTSKTEDQDNEFKATDSSIDEKHVLNSEGLGSKSESLFPDDSRHVNALEQGNKHGYSD